MNKKKQKNVFHLGWSRMGMAGFDWHSDGITRVTVIDARYRNTQNVRRFFRAECGAGFAFDRPFMAWIKAGVGRTMGEAADEWLRRQAGLRATT